MKTKKKLPATDAISRIGGPEAAFKLLQDFANGISKTQTDDEGLIKGNYMQFANRNQPEDGEEETILIRKFIHLNIIRK